MMKKRLGLAALLAVLSLGPAAYAAPPPSGCHVLSLEQIMHSLEQGELRVLACYY